MAAATISAQELTTLGADIDLQEDHEEQQHRDFQTLAPADSSKEAYLFLAACVGLEALVWGFPFAVSHDHPVGHTCPQEDTDTARD